METYVVLRRSAWPDAVELRDASVRSAFADDAMQDEVACLRTYVVEECDRRLGTVAVYQATSPEALRRHSASAGLAVDEIVKVADVVVVRPDPAAATA